MDIKKLKYCIVGLGLLGGSYAMALSKKGAHVCAVDIDEKSIDFAVQNGYIKEGATKNYDRLIQTADVIVVALYPNATVEWVKNHAHMFKENAILTDVCGVKSGIVEEIQQIMPENTEFIATHPMAGKEVSGVFNANDTMFKKANFIIVPTEKNTQNAINFATSLAEILGFSKVSQLSCEKHDEMIAYLSQLTHAIAVSLMNCAQNDDINKYTGDSFRDLTRIAKINAPMWRELFICNKAALISEIDKFTASLDDLRTKLQNEDAAALEALFVNSTQKRKTFDKQDSKQEKAEKQP